MADITKRVDRAIPPNERVQEFSSTGDSISVGDVVLVKDSLGHPASRVTISVTTDPLTVQFNVRKTLFPLRKQGEGFSSPLHQLNVGGIGKGPSGGNLALGQEVDTDAAVISIGQNETLELDNDFPVSDIKIVSDGGSAVYIIVAS